MPWSSPPDVAFDNQRSATFRHRLAASIDIWTGDALCTANADVVGAVFSTATEVERNEEIVVVVFPNDVRSFDRAWQC